MKLTTEQNQILREAIFKISDATQELEELNAQMKAQSNWSGQADVAALISDLKEVHGRDECGYFGGGIFDKAIYA